MKILKPEYGHAGDAFRELLDMWEELGLCELAPSDDDFCWIEEKNTIILYDHPRIDDRRVSPFTFGLFGNTIPSHERIKPWIFWARHPKKLLKRIEKGLPDYSERNIQSIFLGKVENNIQLGNRNTHDWSTGIELFSMPILLGNVSHWPYSQEEYLDKVAHSKFGLCLPGYGPKCNREIEYMGLGVVPIIVPGVDLTYHNPWSEGVHYIRVDNPEQIKEKIESISEKEWKDMSSSCIRWYNENCSPVGSFNVTKEILNNA